ncbi:MAG TPA: sugar ABC transporter permease [Candidatus Fimadaptatus faecigallinarum]|uniref:Sugar ABC transporter permease n=1 Tax=Candidatus Fimadaptatus faecigallinarum TaxID=2840814 RepID=A0A9D1LQE5_9FIRM|nr:sugar ABC transporter permease [Candidatus Fimadaptatus faecigallinarum]
MKASKLLRQPGFRLFLLTTPLLVLVFLFSYLPLFGWSYAFMDYRAGMKLQDTPFVGLKYFQSIFGSSVKLRDIARVMRNTLGMSLLGIVTSPLPMLFAIMLYEMRSSGYRRVVQTLTTLPNFISWVLVYSVAYSMFSVGDGFVNRLLMRMGIIDSEINFLASRNHVWLTMWAYGTWKSLGWSAVMYLAALAGIDQELYEAARVDGAGRWNVILHIEIPGLMPTFFVLLLLSIANIINNGMEQYYVFENAMNKAYIEVLDLYVYNQGLAGNQIPYATAVGMLKSLVSLVLLTLANLTSKAIRGESIL